MNQNSNDICRWKHVGRVGFIGAGKAGVTLGKHFTAHGITVSGYASRQFSSAKEAAEFTSSRAYEDISALVEGSDTLFLTVPDGQIKQVWDDMQTLPVDLTGKIICHASGSLSSDIFSGSQTEIYGFSIHPLYAMSDKLHSYEQMSSCLFTVEGPECTVREELVAMLSSCGNEVEIISAQNKPLYHAAAVVVSNFTAGLSYLGSRMLLECGFSRENADKALLPLMRSSVCNIERQGSVKALTGPVERADLETVSRHLKAIRQMEKDASLTQEVYGCLTKVLIEMAKEKKEDYQLEGWKEILDNYE